MGQYLPIFALLVLAAVFGIVSRVAQRLLVPPRPTPAKIAPYECGILPSREPPHRFPVRLWKYEIRRNSGGAGERRGGDGVVREVGFLEPLTVSFLTERRGTRPRGLHGGGDGSSGRQTRIFPDGREEVLPGAVTYHAEAGERVRIETPGGGGWG